MRFDCLIENPSSSASGRTTDRPYGSCVRRANPSRDVQSPTNVQCRSSRQGDAVPESAMEPVPADVRDAAVSAGTGLIAGAVQGVYRFGQNALNREAIVQEMRFLLECMRVEELQFSALLQECQECDVDLRRVDIAVAIHTFRKKDERGRTYLEQLEALFVEHGDDAMWWAAHRERVGSTFEGYLDLMRRAKQQLLQSVQLMRPQPRALDMDVVKQQERARAYAFQKLLVAQLVTDLCMLAVDAHTLGTKRTLDDTNANALRSSVEAAATALALSKQKCDAVIRKELEQRLDTVGDAMRRSSESRLVESLEKDGEAEKAADATQKIAQLERQSSGMRRLLEQDSIDPMKLPPALRNNPRVSAAARDVEAKEKQHAELATELAEQERALADLRIESQYFAASETGKRHAAAAATGSTGNSAVPTISEREIVEQVRTLRDQFPDDGDSAVRRNLDLFVERLNRAEYHTGTEGVLTTMMDQLLQDCRAELVTIGVRAHPV